MRKLFLSLLLLIPGSVCGMDSKGGEQPSMSPEEAEKIVTNAHLLERLNALKPLINGRDSIKRFNHGWFEIVKRLSIVLEYDATLAENKEVKKGIKDIWGSQLLSTISPEKAAIIIPKGSLAERLEALKPLIQNCNSREWLGSVKRLSIVLERDAILEDNEVVRKGINDAWEPRLIPMFPPQMQKVFEAGIKKNLNS